MRASQLLGLRGESKGGVMRFEQLAKIATSQVYDRAVGRQRELEAIPSEGTKGAFTDTAISTAIL